LASCIGGGWHEQKRQGKIPKSKGPKTKLGLPDLDRSKSAVLDSLASPESKRGYRHAIDEITQWYCSRPRLSFNKVVVPLPHFPWPPDGTDAGNGFNTTLWTDSGNVMLTGAGTVTLENIGGGGTAVICAGGRG